MTDSKEKQAFKFDVFISYRHAELDGAVAGYLQKALEHYRIPREIRKKCGKKNCRVFRDEEELGAASDLFSQIEQNLVQSEFLLVICSPRILESRWCMREIETFIRHRGRENVLAVLIEGEPETAFPPILLERGEPLAADLRGKNMREVLYHARQRMLRVVAPLLHCAYDELYQRHRVYKMRRVLALAGLVTAVSLMFGGVTVLQNREISRNYQGKLENQSRYLAQTSAELLQSGDRDAALLVALEALPKGSQDTSRPYVAEARIALERALYTYNLNYRYQLRPMKRLEHKGSIRDCVDCSEEEKVLLTADTDIYIWDAETCENICCWEENGGFKDARLVGSHSAAVLTDGGIFCFDYRTRQILWEWDFPACEAGDYCGGVETIWTYDAVSNRILCGNKNLCAHRTADGSGMEISPAHSLYLIDAATGQSRSWVPEDLNLLLAEEPYSQMYFTDGFFSLAPGGERLAACVRSYVDFQSVYTLYVLDTGKGNISFEQNYGSAWTGGDLLEAVSWLDEDTLAIVRILEEGNSQWAAGQSRAWVLECRDMDTGAMRFSHADTCMSLSGTVSVEKVLPEEGREDTLPLVRILYDNVAVCLDWDTGEQYSRVEDRSAIVLDHIWNSNFRVMVTADNYLFTTSPTRDVVRDPLYSAYHYYLGLDTIRKAVWCNGRAFFFTSDDVYCYVPAADSSYTLLEAAPSVCFFTQDSERALLLCDDGQISLYDTENFDLLWQAPCLYDYICAAAALPGDRYAVYMDRTGAAVHAYALRDGSDLLVELDDISPSLQDSTKWDLRAAGESCVLVWNREKISMDFYGDLHPEDLEGTAVWMVDAEQGAVVDRWSYRDMIERFPDSFSEQGMSVSLGEPAATADGRYVLIPCRIRGWLEKDAGQEDAQSTERAELLVWDRETGQPVVLPDETVQGMAWELPLGTYFEQDGWVSPTEDAVVFYNEESRCLQILDLTRGEILHKLEVDGIACNEVSFTPDGDHLIFQDARMQLSVYNWKKGRYTMQGISPEIGYMKFAFYQDGEVLSAAVKANLFTTDTTQLYRRTEEGVYKLDTSISFCGDCDGRTVVIGNDAYPRLYHAYSLDDLIARAREILNGRELTQPERRSYLID